jgi:predicted nucleotidyltransferase component of viral defense system
VAKPLVRVDREAFAALRDQTAARMGMPVGIVEKDYWAVEVLRSVTAPLSSVERVVFKGGTSLSKVYGLIERFSEDIDVIAVVDADLSQGQVKKVLRRLADRVGTDLAVASDREAEGRGFVNVRYSYPAEHAVSFLSVSAVVIP